MSGGGRNWDRNRERDRTFTARRMEEELWADERAKRNATAYRRASKKLVTNEHLTLLKWWKFCWICPEHINAGTPAALDAETGAVRHLECILDQHGRPSTTPTG